ncbi:MAG TPA: hypothetical protein VLA09_09655 [Longimicrobiales bacterium]|nr:hypothetical protein [Longimicrobiales bacterium]
MGISRGNAREFVLILIGVFLALAAERWVAGRSDRNLAAQYAADLATDLRQDSVQHVVWSMFTAARQQALERMLADLNQVSPRLSGAEELGTLYYAQIVPVPDFQRATFQDLVSSGNLRLLDPAVRRGIVVYHDGLDALTRGVALTGLGKPRFADLVPAQARATLTDTCAGQPSRCGFGLADSVLADMPDAEVVALASWRDMPDMRLELQRMLNETHAFRRGFERLGPRLWEALAVVERSAM